MLILCYLDLVFFLADIFFTFDGDAFPVMYLLKHGATNKSSYSLSYALARQVSFVACHCSMVITVR